MEPYIPPNPNTPFFRVKVGDVVLDPPKPKYLKSFSASIGGSTSFSVNLEMFDPEWKVLESLFAKNNLRFSVQWGYWEGEISRWHHCVITNYVPNYNHYGVGISLSAHGYADIKMKDKIVSRSFPEGMRISDVVAEICRLNNWRIGRIEETVHIMDRSDHKTGQMVPKTWSFSQMSDLQFIRNTLCQYATSKEGLSGYSFFLDEAEDPPVAYFYPFAKDYRLQSEVVYVYQRDRMGVVKSFSPNLEGPVLLAMLGTSGSTYHSDDPYDRCSVRYDVNYIDKTEQRSGPGNYEEHSQPHSNKPVAERREEIQVAIPNEKGVFNNTNHLHSIPDEAKNKALSHNHNALYKTFYAAEMEILGDPRYDIRMLGKPIHILMYYGDGEVYTFSGKYLINEISHEISGGSYTTRLTLNKIGYDEGVFKSVGILAKE